MKSMSEQKPLTQQEKDQKIAELIEQRQILKTLLLPYLYGRTFKPNGEVESASNDPYAKELEAKLEANGEELKRLRQMTVIQ